MIKMKKDIFLLFSIHVDSDEIKVAYTVVWVLFYVSELISS